MTPTPTVPTGTVLVSASLGKTDNLEEQKRKHLESERAADDDATVRITGVDLSRGFLKSKQVLLKVLAARVDQAETTMDALFVDPATAIPATPVGQRRGVLGYYAVGRMLQTGRKGVRDIKSDCLYVVADWTPRTMLIITEGQPHPLRQAQQRRTDHGPFVGLTVLMVVNVDVLVPVPQGVEPRLASLAADWLAMICHGVHSGAKLKPPQNDAADKNTGNDTKENMSSREPKVLVYGAEGPGMLALQIAKHCGAEVFACDPTPHNRTLAMKAINRLGSVFAPEEVEEGEIPVEVDVVIDMVHDDESMRVGGALISRTQEIKHWAVLFNRPNIWEWATKNSEAIFSKVVSITTVRHESVTKRDIEDALQFLVDAPPYPAPRASTSQCPTLYNIHYILLDLETVSGEGRAVVTFPTQLSGGQDATTHLRHHRLGPHLRDAAVH